MPPAAVKVTVLLLVGVVVVSILDGVGVGRAALAGLVLAGLLYTIVRFGQGAAIFYAVAAIALGVNLYGGA